MTVLVTAASGHLGRLVLDSLLARGVPAADIRAGARTPESLAGYADRGVDVVPLDYDDPSSAAAAVKGVDRVLLVSGSEVGRRVEQHRAVIDAARAEGVQHLIYTSAPKANDTTLVLAPEHRATEELVRTSGIPFTVLRNNWYTENYAQDLATLATPPTSGGDAFIGADLSVNGVQKSGYLIALAAGANSAAVRTSANTCNGTNSFSTYHATATPATVGQSGTRAFATNNSGAIYQNFTGAAIPVTMAGTQILQ